MAEPTSTTAVGVAMGGVGVFALFPIFDAGVVLGAFAGAAVFVLNSSALGNLRKFAYFGLAFVAGLLAAQMAADMLALVLPARVQVPVSVGAMLAAALVINLLIALIGHALDPVKLLTTLRGGGKS